MAPSLRSLWVWIGGGGIGDDPVQQLDVAVPEFGVVGLVRVEVELFLCANRGVDGDVLPFSV